MFHEESKEDIAEDLQPHPKIVRAPRASKISTDLQFYTPSYNFTETNRNFIHETTYSHTIDSNIAARILA